MYSTLNVTFTEVALCRLLSGTRVCNKIKGIYDYTDGGQLSFREGMGHFDCKGN